MKVLFEYAQRKERPESGKTKAGLYDHIPRGDWARVKVDKVKLLTVRLLVLGF